MNFRRKQDSVYSKKKDEISLNLIDEIKRNIKLEYDEANPDIVITVGGDGTIIRAVNKYIDIVDKVTFFGVKTGHLGFYTNFTKDSLNELIALLKILVNVELGTSLILYSFSILNPKFSVNIFLTEK